MKPMDYDALEFHCAPASRGVCNRRYDVPGTYYYTSGQVTGGNEPVAFSGKVIVLDVKQRTTPLLVLKKGKFVKRDFLTCLKFTEKVFNFHFLKRNPLMRKFQNGQTHLKILKYF